MAGEPNELSADEIEQVQQIVDSGGDFDDHLKARISARLSDHLARRETVDADTTALLARRLAEPLDASVWQSITDSLSGLLDDRPSGLFLSWLLADATSGRIASLEGGAASAFAWRLRALFGREIDVAVAHASFGPDDWFRVERLVYVNQETGLPGVRTTIRKVNGESVVVEGAAASLLPLVRLLLDSILAVGNRDYFIESDREAFLATLEKVQEMLSPAQ